jgi:hypothetical protein
MKRTTIALLGLLMLIVVSASVAEKTPASAAFEKMKTMAGKWRGTYQGNTDTMTLSVVSQGSALMQADEHASMITMFHLDRDRLMMTHYCAAQNQPRMVGELRPDGSIEFKFLDATNLTSPTMGRMNRMILTMKDANTIEEQWFFADDGKTEGKGETFVYTRVK